MPTVADQIDPHYSNENEEDEQSIESEEAEFSVLDFVRSPSQYFKEQPYDVTKKSKGKCPFRLDFIENWNIRCERARLVLRQLILRGGVWQALTCRLHISKNIFPISSFLVDPFARVSSLRNISNR